LTITGSNSRLLSRELATHLTGRYLEYHMFPFSFIEFLRAKKIEYGDAVNLKNKQGLIMRSLSEYFSSGGLPEVVTKSMDPKAYLTTLFESILFKDVTKRYNIRYPRKLYDLAFYLTSNHSCEFSHTKLKNVLGFRSVHTVQNYVGYLDEAFLVFSLKRFSFKLKHQLKAPEKAYVYDTGIASAVKFGMTADYGQVMENVVAIELLRRKKEIYYFKNRNGAEVDFVVKQGLRVSELIQVCCDISDTDVKKREVRAIVKANKELGADRNTIITWDFEAEEKHGNYEVSFIPLWRWLLYQL